MATNKSGMYLIFFSKENDITYMLQKAIKYIKDLEVSIITSWSFTAIKIVENEIRIKNEYK